LNKLLIFVILVFALAGCATDREPEFASKNQIEAPATEVIPERVNPFAKLLNLDIASISLVNIDVLLPHPDPSLNFRQEVTSHSVIDSAEHCKRFVMMGEEFYSTPRDPGPAHTIVQILVVVFDTSSGFETLVFVDGLPEPLRLEANRTSTKLDLSKQRKWRKRHRGANAAALKIAQEW
jgi:hypothetical protein